MLAIFGKTALSLSRVIVVEIILLREKSTLGDTNLVLYSTRNNNT